MIEEKLAEKLSNLSSLLDTEIKFHENLKEKLERKLDAIGERNWEKLKELMEEEDEIISKISDTESERVVLIEEIADELNIPKDIKAFDLCENLPEPFSANFMLKFARLMELLNDISLLNMCVRGLLEFESSYVDLTLKLLSGRLNKNVYTKTGKEKDLSSSTFLDGRV